MRRCCEPKFGSPVGLVSTPNPVKVNPQPLLGSEKAPFAGFGFRPFRNHFLRKIVFLDAFHRDFSDKIIFRIPSFPEIKSPQPPPPPGKNPSIPKGDRQPVPSWRFLAAGPGLPEFNNEHCPTGPGSRIATISSLWLETEAVPGAPWDYVPGPPEP